MNFRWLFILLVPVALIVGWHGMSRDSREQTVFLERIAEAIEQARTIPPETDHAIKDAVVSIRRRATPVDEVLLVRQKRAIERIDAARAFKDTAQTAGIASRDLFRREVPAE